MFRVFWIIICIIGGFCSASLYASPKQNITLHMDIEKMLLVGDVPRELLSKVLYKEKAAIEQCQPQETNLVKGTLNFRVFVKNGVALSARFKKKSSTIESKTTIACIENKLKEIKYPKAKCPCSYTIHLNVHLDVQASLQMERAEPGHGASFSQPSFYCDQF